MISQLEGKIVWQDLRSIILDVHGVGYKITVTGNTLAEFSKKKTTIRVWTHLVVKEDALDLYGFSGEEELRFFEQLLTVSGIGPKTAIAILSNTTIETLRSGIVSGDPSLLTKISGIGKKMAEKIILELKEKIDTGENDQVLGKNLQNESDALEALVTLGYSQKEARDVLKKIDNTIGTTDKIKNALKLLGSPTK